MARPKKQQRLKLTTFTNNSGNESWRVAGYMPDGKRIRQNFKDKADALRNLADLHLEIEKSPEPRKPQRTVLTPPWRETSTMSDRPLNGSLLLFGWFLERLRSARSSFVWSPVLVRNCPRKAAT